MSEEYNQIIERLVSLPLKSQIKIDFDFAKRNFILSVPIFFSKKSLPSSVKEYVEARQNHRFKPHETSFKLSGAGKVNLVQEVPFQWGFQPGLREQVMAFWKLSKHCHRLLVEIAVEEKYHSALHLDPDFNI